MGNLRCLQADRQQFGRQDAGVGEGRRFLESLYICDRMYIKITATLISYLIHFANQILKKDNKKQTKKVTK